MHIISTRDRWTVLLKDEMFLSRNNDFVYYSSIIFFGVTRFRWMIFIDPDFILFYILELIFRSSQKELTNYTLY